MQAAHCGLPFSKRRIQASRRAASAASARSASALKAQADHEFLYGPRTTACAPGSAQRHFQKRGRVVRTSGLALCRRHGRDAQLRFGGFMFSCNPDTNPIGQIFVKPLPALLRRAIPRVLCEALLAICSRPAVRCRVRSMHASLPRWVQKMKTPGQQSAHSFRRQRTAPDAHAAGVEHRVGDDRRKAGDGSFTGAADRLSKCTSS